MTAAAPDRVRARLGREWTLTVEVVTPPPDDAATRARILALADAVRDDDRIAALTLTDRTASPAADPVSFAPEVMARVGTSPLVHLAGKARDTRDLEDALRRCEAAGVGSVLLTGGDLLDSRAPGAQASAPLGAAPGRVSRSARPSGLDAVEMIRIAAASTPALGRIAVATLPRTVRGAVSWERVAAKRDAGADAFVTQVSWDLSEREIVAEWQTRLAAPILGAVVFLTGRTLTFLAAHRIAGIAVPPALRAQAASDGREGAIRRLALDLMLLRGLGYAGAHVSGIITPSLLGAVLDEAARLNGALGDDWRGAWDDGSRRS